MKRRWPPTVSLVFALAMALMFPTASEAHEVSYINIIVPGSPAYVVGLSIGLETIEERSEMSTGIYGRQWEFFGDGRITYMTFVRHDPEHIKSGETFEVIEPKREVFLENETAKMKELAGRATCWYEPRLSDSCPVSGPQDLSAG